MSKQKTPPPRPNLIVVVTPAHGGGYQARLDGDGRVLCVSRTPFFDAARIVEVGYDPDTTLVLRHEGSDADSLRAKLGTAASLTVEETGYGSRIHPWKAFLHGGDDADHRAEQTGAIRCIQ